ncbi:MAG TPA: complement resistance protein TraT [Halomonas sp.]|nr:complement resistance protein TraT [Halomonas sp.]
MRIKSVLLVAAMAGALLLSGCAATHTAITKRNLDVQTKMSETVFLDPRPASEKVVYLQIRNTSDEQGITIEPKIRQAVESRGYTVTNDLDQAYYLLQTNILQVGETDLRGAQTALAQGYGAGLTGAVVGGAAFGGGSGRVGTALVGGLVGMAANAMVKDVHFTMITDLQISERAAQGVVISENNRAALKQGTSGHRTVTSHETTDWHRYQTRIVSTANQVNLTFDKALPELEQGLSQSIAGLL